MNITEVFIGTPEERQARRTRRHFKQNPPTEHSGRRRAAQAEVLANTLTRRQILIFGPLAITALVVAGGKVIESKLARPIYDGPIEEMVGLPELDDESFTAMVESLIQTNVPFLKKLALDVQQLHTQDHSSLPQWMLQRDSVPLPIVIDKNTDVSETLINFENGNPADVGIILGGKLFGKFDVGDAMLLAKEYATIMIYFRCFEEGYDWIVKNIGPITNSDGSPISDRIDQLRAGMSLVAGQLEAERDWNDILDGLPVFLLASAVQDGIAAGTIPHGVLQRMSMNVAAKYLEDPAVNSLTREIRAGWEASENSLTPRLSLMDIVFVERSPLIDSISGYWQKIDEPVGTPISG